MKVYSVTHSFAGTNRDPEVEVFSTYEEAVDSVRELFEHDMQAPVEEIESRQVEHDYDDNITKYAIVAYVKGNRVVRQATMKKHILG